MFQFEVEDPADDGELVSGQGQFKVGDRIKCDDHFGTVHYIGSVGNYQGTWLGVEWDDAARGKHSGSVDGVQYFTSWKPNSASFVKIHKAQKLVNILEALLERYGEDPKIFVNLKSIQDRLDKKKISFGDLKVLNLTERGISELENGNQLTQLCPKVEVLEISDNLIKNWASLGRLCRGWSKLRRLDVSRNPIDPPSQEEIMEHQDSFKGLDHIVCGNINYDWDTLLKASEMWGQIIQLTAPFNNISTLCMPSKTLRNLTSIDLGKNKISSWDDVMKLGGLEKLECLNLCGNHIAKITMIQENNFQSLERLNISENFIDNWISVSELNKLSSLKELRMDINPVLNQYKRETNRQLIIARIEKLQKLEGVDIHRQERRDAELDYVKLYTKEYSKAIAAGEKENFIKEHPFFPKFIKEFGLVINEKENNNSMKSTLINLIIVPESSLSYKECEKKVLKTMTVQKLKALLQRMFKLPPVPIQIIVNSCKNPEISFELDNDFAEIAQYSVEDGDTLRLKW